MKITLSGFGGILLFTAFFYVFFSYNFNLLSDEACLKIASNSVLGNKLYGNSCARSFYTNDVKKLHGKNSTSAFFEFVPLDDKKKQCVAIKVVVDRKTGEVWRVN